MSHQAIILLAAGASRRMGQPKQLLPLEGKPLIRTICERLLTTEDSTVFVVLGAYAKEIRPVIEDLPVVLVDAANWEEGISASIRAGIEAVEAAQTDFSGALVCLCDQVDISGVGYQCLLWAADSKSIVSAMYEGIWGAPAWFPQSFFDQLKALSGDQGARSLIKQYLDKNLVIGWPLDEAATDWDTPGDVSGSEPIVD